MGSFCQRNSNGISYIHSKQSSMHGRAEIRVVFSPTDKHSYAFRQCHNADVLVWEAAMGRFADCLVKQATDEA